MSWSLPKAESNKRTFSDAKPCTPLMYKNTYIKYGFTCEVIEDQDYPKCLQCGQILPNESMVAQKLKKHFDSEHSNIKNELIEKYFKALLKSKNKEENIPASRKVAEMIVEKMQPHTMVETLILPACKEIIKSVLGNDAENTISNAISNRSIAHYIANKSSDIQKKLVEKLQKAKKFSLLLDLHHAYQVSYVRFLDGDSIVEHFLSYIELPEDASLEIIYNSLITMLNKNGLCSENCVSVFVASKYAEENESFASYLKEKDFNKTIYCSYGRHVLITETVPNALYVVILSMDEMVQCVLLDQNAYDVRQILCQNIETRYRMLLGCHSGWMYRSNVLSTFYNQRGRLLEIFNGKHPEFCKLLNDKDWCTKLAYLADITQEVINLHENMHGDYKYILTSKQEVQNFSKNIETWMENVKENDFSMFQLTREADARSISNLILKHLSDIKCKLSQYFPFANVDTFTNTDYEKYINDENLQPMMGETQRLKFWNWVKLKYPTLGETVLSDFLHFSSSNMLDLGRSALRAIIFNNEKRLVPAEEELRLYLSLINTPRIEEIGKTNNS